MSNTNLYKTVWRNFKDCMLVIVQKRTNELLWGTVILPGWSCTVGSNDTATATNPTCLTTSWCYTALYANWTASGNIMWVLPWYFRDSYSITPNIMILLIYSNSVTPNMIILLVYYYSITLNVIIL